MNSETYHSDMKDAQVRALVLKALYDCRKKEIQWRHLADWDGGPLVKGIDEFELTRILHQLEDHGLVKFSYVKLANGATRGTAAKISASGVDVMEGTRVSPITITISASNAIVGDHGNIQNTP